MMSYCTLFSKDYFLFFITPALFALLGKDKRLECFCSTKSEKEAEKILKGERERRKF